MEKFFKKLFGWVKTEARELKKLVNKYGKEAVAVLQVFKYIVENQSIKLIAKNTATKIDDALLVIISQALETILGAVKTEENATLADKVAVYIEQLRGFTGEHKAAIYLKIASFIIRELAAKDETEIRPSDADTIAQISYKAIADDHRI